MNEISINDLSEEVISIRRHLHLYPELSLKENNTSKYIVNYLKSIGLNPKLIGGTGVVVNIIKDKSLKTVAIRAEMDALPITEEGNKIYKSKIDGVMHACGHDAIVATALGLAKLINFNRYRLPCNVKFIFQPGEETGNGSKILIDEKVLENPNVDNIIFFHYTNEDILGMDMQKDFVSGTVGGFNISIKGKSSHWSEYEKGIDSIKASSKVINAIESINNIKMNNPFIIGIGRINGGTSNNIIAENVELGGSIRTYTINEYKKVVKNLKSEMKIIEKETGAKIIVEECKNPIPPMYNSKELLEKAYKVGKNTFGERCTISSTPYLSGDNASLYLQSTKGLFIAFFDQIEGEESYPLHNSKFDINERVFPYALKVLYDLVFELY